MEAKNRKKGKDEDEKYSHIEEVRQGVDQSFDMLLNTCNVSL